MRITLRCPNLPSRRHCCFSRLAHMAASRSAVRLSSWSLASLSDHQAVLAELEVRAGNSLAIFELDSNRLLIRLELQLFNPRLKNFPAFGEESGRSRKRLRCDSDPARLPLAIFLMKAFPVESSSKGTIRNGSKRRKKGQNGNPGGYILFHVGGQEWT
jgi:hypothetical protein